MTSQRPVHAVPPGYLRLLGDMTVTFGLIHFQLMTIAHCVIGLDKSWERAITAELSLMQLRSIILSVYRERYGEDADFAQLRELISQAEALEQRRNSITHSFWTVGEDMSQASRLKITSKQRRGLRHVFEHTTETSLTNDVASFHKLASDLRDFEIRVCHYLPTKSPVHPWA